MQVFIAVRLRPTLGRGLISADTEPSTLSAFHCARINTFNRNLISIAPSQHPSLSPPLLKTFLNHPAELSLVISSQDAVTICTLGIGTAFGESILDNTPRHATIVTREFSELLRIDQREFKCLWEVGAFALLSLSVSVYERFECRVAGLVSQHLFPSVHRCVLNTHTGTSEPLHEVALSFHFLSSL